MYNVIKETNNTYGNIISINIEDIGEFELPFDAINKAKSIKKLWAIKGKIRFLINGQVMNIKQAESWAFNEYKSLPKCHICPTIMVSKEIYTHAHSGNKTFCSQLCADTDYKYYVENLDEEYECDFR